MTTRDGKMKAIQAAGRFAWRGEMRVFGRSGNARYANPDATNLYDCLGPNERGEPFDADAYIIKEPLLAYSRPANWGFLLDLLRQVWPDVGINVNEYYRDDDGFKEGDRPWSVWECDGNPCSSLTFDHMNLGCALVDALYVAMGLGEKEKS